MLGVTFLCVFVRLETNRQGVVTTLLVGRGLSRHTLYIARNAIRTHLAIVTIRFFKMRDGKGDGWGLTNTQNGDPP